MADDTRSTEERVPSAQLSHRGFSALVLVDGVPAPVYRPEYDSHTDNILQPIEDKRIMTGWIASEEGKTFSVAFRNDDGEDSEHASSGHIFVDGQDAASAILRPGRIYPATRHGARLSDDEVRPWTFSKLELTDDDSVADPGDPRAKDIGTIQVKIKYIKLGSAVPMKKTKLDDVGLVHEKAKKAGIHTTTYKTRQKLAKSRAVSNKPLYPNDEWEHHVVFTFRYRSREILMAEGIIPRPEKTAEDTDPLGEQEKDIPKGRKRVWRDESDDEEITESQEDGNTSKRHKSYHPSSEDDGGMPDDTMDEPASP
ncbi:hypothetical protein M407DRAFT_240654 [Tulasnella calospora MUT 4182]|uniref:DUF7918 domain-containing protein n=1 Tax=Tulasnella calospora MUT 4182 TaxID=1051891 RepID=A0A0C3MKV5_9AGAM|nr:hypothetical protein M407DRAFT_240654 [Tulasnella calospora MUT 4182]